MLSSHFQSLVQSLPLIPHSAVYILSSCAIAAGVLILWRLLRFTVVPFFYPHDPIEIPYWIPVLGHAIPFFKNSNHFVYKCREYVGDEDSIFTISLPGTKLYVIQGVKDILSVYKNTSTLSMEGFVRMLLSSMGHNDQSIEKMMLEPKDCPDYPINPENTGHQNLMQFGRKLHKNQLLPGDSLDQNYKNFIHGFETSIDVYLPSPESKSCSVSLLDLCSNTVIPAGLMSMLGPDFPTQHPQFLEEALSFMDESWKLLFKLPKFAARDMYDARTRGIKTLQDYVQRNAPDFEATSFILKNIIKDALALGLTEHEASTLLFMFVWLGNANTYLAVFWILCAMLMDRSLYERILVETQAAWSKDTNQLNLEYLLNNSPVLTSTYQEVFRVRNDAASIRNIEVDTVIGGKVLRKGQLLWIPYRLTHLKTSSFGADCMSFDPLRFLNNPKLVSRGDYRPFGGGFSLCPARFLARNEIFGVVGILLNRFSFELDYTRGLPKRPRVNDDVRSNGIMGPMPGDDLQIIVTKAQP